MDFIWIDCTDMALLTSILAYKVYQTSVMPIPIHCYRSAVCLVISVLWWCSSGWSWDSTHLEMEKSSLSFLFYFFAFSNVLLLSLWFAEPNETNTSYDWRKLVIRIIKSLFFPFFGQMQIVFRFVCFFLFFYGHLPLNRPKTWWMIWNWQRGAVRGWLVHCVMESWFCL